MTPNGFLDDAFVRVLLALEPYLSELVVAGAWAHRLYTLHPLAQRPTFTPIMTLDADMAAPEALEKKEQSIPALLKGAGFKTEYHGETMIFQVPDERDGFYVEFIAPLVGSLIKRDENEPDRTTNIAGAVAAKLRFVELLLLEPWAVTLSKDLGIPALPQAIHVRVANPANYLIQKVLTLTRRSTSRKSEKDVLYVHDTLSIFGSRLTELRQLGQTALRSLPSATFEELKRLSRDLFSREDLLKGASIIAEQSGRENPPSSSRIGVACRMGLAEVFS